jgi:aminomuconate-semialdehyde/2-hydroxymuconate-6-semialdehyde dehydrogenase
MIQLKNYINGELVAPSQNQYFDNFEPATGQVYSTIPDSDAQDVELAYKAANDAFESWSNTTLDFRFETIMKLVRLIEQNHHKLAEAESKDNGKPLKLAMKVDIPRAAANFKFFANAITQFASESHNMPGEDTINYTLRQPIGVVGCISPWNLPLYLFTWKIAPALAAGNTVVAKPSEITPYTAYLLSELAIEAGFPKGVLNIVHGYGNKVGDAITRHPGIKAISFTGGTSTGKIISSIAGPMFKKLSLELGGKNPNIIFADADFDLAVRTSVLSSFANQGQICLCGSRIFIERSIYDKFKKAFVEKVKNLQVGDPLDPDSNLGAVVSQDHFGKVLSYIELAKEEGGTLLAGGNAVHIDGRCHDGWFIEPTVFENLAYDCRTNQEEIFGPVVTLTPFDSEEEAIMMANSTEYGLASTVWTTNVNTANRVAYKLKSGIVWVNCWLHRDLRTPFGGVKSSGIGREGGFEALKFFTEAKNVCIKW